MGGDVLTPLIRGMRTSVRNNSAAYGYSVTITATFGALNALSAPQDVVDVLLFVAGAAFAFSVTEVVASKGFKVTDHSEPEEVVLIATSFNVFSMSSAVALGSLVGWLLSGWIAWLVGSFAATVSYLFVVGIEMAVAERAEKSS
jgi:hypothetical protein